MLNEMSDQAQLATEPTKTALENSVGWFLQDKLRDASTPIATKKYLTNKNELVYLTRTSVAESSVPTVKVQVFIRVQGGVAETGYQLYGDHRFQKYRNDMIFGTKPGAGPAGDAPVDVTEAEAQSLLALVNSLTTARQTL
jgi:hypothetical protein